MALQIHYADPTGGNISSAYCRIVEIAVNVPQQTARIVMNVYRDASSYGNGHRPVDQVGVAIGPSAQDGLPAFDDFVSGLQNEYDALAAALYGLLKTRPQFVEAIDV